MSEDLKIAVDIAKTKLYFFSALAGSVWVQLTTEVSFPSVIMSVAFIGSMIGVIKNLLLLGKYEKGLQND